MPTTARQVSATDPSGNSDNVTCVVTVSPPEVEFEDYEALIAEGGGGCDAGGGGGGGGAVPVAVVLLALLWITWRRREGDARQV